MADRLINNLIPHSKPTIRKNELQNTLNCMITDYIGPGDLVRQFEKSLSSALNGFFVKTTSSGLTAFFLILKLLDIKPGDQIILPSYAPLKLLNVLSYFQAEPVVVDKEAGDYAPSFEAVEKKMNPRVKAILLVPLFGQPIHTEKYSTFKVPVIEDAAQSFGSEFQGRKSGSRAEFSFLSFYATKLITTGGTGGAVVCQNPEDYQRLISLSADEPSETQKTTYPFYMSDLQASMGIAQLTSIDELIQSRQKIADFYDSKMKIAGKETQPLFIDRKFSYYRYIIKSGLDIEESLQLFKNYGIDARKPIQTPIHRFLSLEKKEFPETEKAFRENISVPIYPTLKKSDAELIGKIITKV